MEKSEIGIYMKKKKGRIKKQIKKPAPAPLKEDEEKLFDFGGIPERDLKKNLGCG